MPQSAAKALVSGDTRTLQYATCSDIGRKRAINQDAFEQILVAEPSPMDDSIEDAEKSKQPNLGQQCCFFVVADGMGAHAAGELASRLAVDEIKRVVSQADASNQLIGAFQQANAIIHEQGQTNPQLYNMGTTCSSLWLLPDGARIGHVGDSRVYRCRNGVLQQLTFDHSLVWEMRAAGQLNGMGQASVPRNVITRCLGPNAQVEVDLEGPFSVRVGDTFLLCSDGLSGPVADAELGAAMRYLDPDSACEFLVDLANLRGGNDNITVTIVSIVGAEAEAGNVSLESDSDGTQDTHPAWWFMAATGMVVGIVAASVNHVPAIIGGGLAFLVASFAILYQWTQNRRRRSDSPLLPHPPYAVAPAEVTLPWIEEIQKTFLRSANVWEGEDPQDDLGGGLSKLRQEIERLPDILERETPQAAMCGIKKIARQLRELTNP